MLRDRPVVYVAGSSRARPIFRARRHKVSGRGAVRDGEFRGGYASLSTTGPPGSGLRWGVAELVGGVLVFLGLLTRVGAFFLAITMLVAMFGVHWGAFFMPRGIEYTVALLGMSLALLVAGGGRFSVDERLQAPPRRRW